MLTHLELCKMNYSVICYVVLNCIWEEPRNTHCPSLPYCKVYLILSEYTCMVFFCAWLFQAIIVSYRFLSQIQEYVHFESNVGISNLKKKKLLFLFENLFYRERIWMNENECSNLFFTPQTAAVVGTEPIRSPEFLSSLPCGSKGSRIWSVFCCFPNHK